MLKLHDLAEGGCQLLGSPVQPRGQAASETAGNTPVGRSVGRSVGR
eukprot:SAG22_NODE_7839_length_703_cov_1.317881_1_plen_45_part_01